MRQKLSKHNLLLVGFTLFSMFFGAGNLIFPPFLGAQAGSLTWQAMGGFLISAVGLPVMGVAAVALSGGLTNLAGRVHPWFAFLFTLLIYLSIGPCLAIPRTASTSFEMTVLPALTAELVTSITAIIKKENALSLGNIIGANVLNITLVLSTATMVSSTGMLPLIRTETGRLAGQYQLFLLDIPRMNL